MGVLPFCSSALYSCDNFLIRDLLVSIEQAAGETDFVLRLHSKAAQLVQLTPLRQLF